MRDEDLCCGKTEAVMSGLDGNCRSPRAGRKKTGKSLNLSLSFFFFKSFMKNLVFVRHSITLFAALSFALISAPVSVSVFISRFVFQVGETFISDRSPGQNLSADANKLVLIL